MEPKAIPRELNTCAAALSQTYDKEHEDEFNIASILRKPEFITLDYYNYFFSFSTVLVNSRQNEKQNRVFSVS